LPVRVLFVAAVCALALPSKAWAHARLIRSSPMDGAVLAGAPARASFVFDDDVRVASGIKAVRNGDGSVLAGNTRVVGGRVLVVPLRTGLEDGDYTVLWRVLSDDGHTVAGVTTFAVGAGRPPPTAALSVDNGPSATDVISRLVFFAGLLTAAGAAFFRFAVGPVPVRLLLGAFLLVFVGVSGTIHGVSSTRFGTVMAVAAGLAGVGALLAALAPVFPRLEPLPFVTALLLLPVPSLSGHALDRGRARIDVFVDFLHVAAASVWLGGLVSLALVLRAGGRQRTTLRRFSNVALVSVVVLAATGIIRAVSELRSMNQLWSTGYGRVLLMKSGLLSILVAIGWLNRYRLIPRLSLRGLRGSVAAELMLFAGLVAAVALLTDLRPGRDRAVAAAATTRSKGPPPVPAKGMVVQAQEDGDYAVALAVRPSGAEVTVLGQDGNGVDGLSVKIGGTRARSCGAGCYGGFVPLKGRAVVSIGRRMLVFRLPVKARPAGGLVEWATRTFRALRSVNYVERLACGPKNRVVADFTLGRPNRLE